MKGQEISLPSKRLDLLRGLPGIVPLLPSHALISSTVTTLPLLFDKMLDLKLSGLLLQVDNCKT